MGIIKAKNVVHEFFRRDEEGNVESITTALDHVNLDVKAGQFIATIEQRQGLKVACPEEIAWRAGWIDAAQLQKLAQPLLKNGYGQYMQQLLKEKVF